MNIFLFEIKSSLKSTLIWILMLGIVAVGFIQVFPAFYSGSAELIKMLENYPKELLEGLDFDPNQFFTILGFYSFIAVYVQVMVAFQGFILGLQVVGRETKAHTMDFLITKPVRRSTILTMKLAAIVTILTVTNLCLFAFTFVGMSITGETFSMVGLVLVSFVMYLCSIIFASIGILLGATLRKLRSIAPYALGIVTGFFILNMMKGIFDDPWIQWLSPFQFFDKFEVISTQSLDPIFLAWSCFLILAMIGVSYLVYTKKDIHAL